MEYQLRRSWRLSDERGFTAEGVQMNTDAFDDSRSGADDRGELEAYSWHRESPKRCSGNTRAMMVPSKTRRAIGAAEAPKTCVESATSSHPSLAHFAESRLRVQRKRSVRKAPK